jgi:hypothetical protein
MNWLLFTLWMPFFSVSGGQTDLSGSWKGILTQDQGGYRVKYAFEIYIIQKGNLISGRSYVSVDNIHAELEIKGEVSKDGATLRFHETRFVQFTRLENLEWCYKSALLEVRKVGKEWRLEGRWQGVASMGPCVPGKIFLTRIPPRV